MSMADGNITTLPPRGDGAGEPDPHDENEGRGPVDSQDLPGEGGPGAEGGGTARHERGRSTIGFPYDDLESAITVATEVHHTYGGQATMSQLAASLGQTVKSGAFRVKVSAARLFGLVTVGRDTATLSELGRRILDPQVAASAASEAFLNVPLYSALYERFKDGTLPDDTGLSAAIAELGVTAKQVQTARQVFQRSAQQAGFFRFGNRRLVLPAAVVANSEPAQVAPLESEHARKDERPATDDLVKHPFILGLLRELPDLKDPFPQDARDTWLAAAKISFDLIYGKVSDSPRKTEGTVSA